MLNNKSILITGGTGSFGKIFVKKIFQIPKNKKLVILSRDELKQFEMSNEFPVRNFINKIFFRDVRDAKRLHTAFEDIDIVVHAAALASSYSRIQSYGICKDKCYRCAEYH